jgi:hypothetical protein
VPELTNWGGFEDWTRVVRGAVVNAGLTDPYVSRAELKAVSRPHEDAEATVRDELLKLGLKEERSAVTAKEIYMKCQEHSYSGRDSLLSALRFLCGARELDTEAIGTAFRSMRDTVGRDGHRLRAKRMTRGNVWWVEALPSG